MHVAARDRSSFHRSRKWRRLRVALDDSLNPQPADFAFVIAELPEDRVRVLAERGWRFPYRQSSSRKTERIGDGRIFSDRGMVDAHDRRAAQRFTHTLHESGGDGSLLATSNPVLRLSGAKDLLEPRNERVSIANALRVDRETGIAASCGSPTTSHNAAKCRSVPAPITKGLSLA